MSRMGDFLLSTKEFAKLNNCLFDQIASRFSLSATEVELILFLAAHPELDLARDVAQFRMLPKSRVSRAVDSLHKKEYLECVPDQDDRRSIHLALSPQAQEMVEASRQLQEETLSALFEGVDDDDYQVMLSVIHKMTHNASRLLQADEKNRLIAGKVR